MKCKLSGCLLLSFLVGVIYSNAQDTLVVKPAVDSAKLEPADEPSPVSQTKWHFLVEPYLMFGNMNGKMGLDSLPIADVDEDAGNIFDHLESGGMLYLEMYNNKWAISVDLTYMKLGQDISQNAMINSGKITLQQFSGELAGLFRIFSFLEAGAGFRVNNIKSELDLNHNTSSGPKQSNWELSETWVDPILVARTRFNLLNNLVYIQLRGDIGGFGIGSDIAWQAQAYAGVRISKLLQASLGYRIVSTDYENGSGKNYFLYDMNVFGPVVKLGFNF